MKIATSPPSHEELQAIKHHFIHTESIHFPINAGEYEKKFDAVIATLSQKKTKPLIVGGTGLYIQAALRGFHVLPRADATLRKELEEKTISELKSLLESKDKETAEKIDKNNKQRLMRALEVCLLSGKKYSELIKEQRKKKYSSCFIGIDIKKELLRERVEKRVGAFFAQGLEEEARELFQWRDFYALQTVGYSEMFEMFDKKLSMNKTIEKIITNTMKYAKRQKTWFKNKENVTWFLHEERDSILSFVEKKLKEIS